MKSSFSNFDTRGNARAITVKNVSGPGTYRSSVREIDGLGRMTKLSVGPSTGSLKIIKTFSYHSDGPGNGQLEEAVRRNHRIAAQTLHSENEPGNYRVTSTFGYDWPAGGTAERRTFTGGPAV